MEFPYGKAPLWILALAIGSGVGVMGGTLTRTRQKPDLVFATFAKQHHESYVTVAPDFEKRQGVTVQLQLLSGRALTSRLQAAILSDAPVPDCVEIPSDAMGYFARGPLEDVGFVDLTDRVKREQLDQRMVESRFSMWSSRGHVFALPHDVHPVGLAYRRDLVEQLGINVETDLQTWDDFVRVGRQVTRDLDGDGIIDRYMMDLPSDGSYGIEILLLQRGINFFDAQGRLIMDAPDVRQAVCDTIMWYLRQTRGKDRISFPCGAGQPLSKAMIDGLCLFYFTPDWRTKIFEMDVPVLAGKMGLMPLPAWERGGRRTSVWGGTGIAIPKASASPELAWEWIKFLYLSKKDLGERFAQTNIIPPLREAWDLPQIQAPDRFFSNQRIGRLMAELAPQAPPRYVTPYTSQAGTKLNEVFLNAALRYESSGERGIEDYIRSEYQKAADYMRRVVDRNAFFKDSSNKSGGGEGRAKEARP